LNTENPSRRYRLRGIALIAGAFAVAFLASVFVPQEPEGKADFIFAALFNVVIIWGAIELIIGAAAWRLPRRWEELGSWQRFLLGLIIICCGFAALFFLLMFLYKISPWIGFSS